MGVEVIAKYRQVSPTKTMIISHYPIFRVVTIEIAKVILASVLACRLEHEFGKILVVEVTGERGVETDNSEQLNATLRKQNIY
jgi:hypothetical protein